MAGTEKSSMDTVTRQFSVDPYKIVGRLVTLMASDNFCLGMNGQSTAEDYVAYSTAQQEGCSNSQNTCNKVY